MSNDDLIKRGDALEICTAYGFSRADECRDGIAALPAVSAPVACHCIGQYGPNPDCGRCGGDGDAGPVSAPDVAELVEALRWYQEQSRLARLIHSEGDAGRHAIAADGGKRAAAALARIGGQ